MNPFDAIRQAHNAVAVRKSRRIIKRVEGVRGSYGTIYADGTGAIHGVKAAKLNAREMSAMKRKMLDAFGSCMDELNEDASRRAGACFGAMQAVKSVVRKRRRVRRRRIK